jgi:hypothetical protein
MDLIHPEISQKVIELLHPLWEIGGVVDTKTWESDVFRRTFSIGKTLASLISPGHHLGTEWSCIIPPAISVLS